MTLNPRMLTLLLLLIGLGLAAACAALLSGWGQSPQWLPAPAAKPVAASAAQSRQAPSADLDSHALAWQQPIFSADRSPDVAVQGASADLAGFTLSGVVLDGGTQVALLRQANGRSLSVRRGQRLDNGWTLEQLDPHEARFTLQGQTRSLRLPSPRLPPPSRSALPKLPNVSAP